MKHTSNKTSCGGIRNWLTEAVVFRWDIPGRVWRHIDQCPRCQRRAMRNARLATAMRLLNTQPQPMKLLLMANCQVLNHLSRSVRQLPQAELLRTQLPKPSWRYKAVVYMQAVSNAAACVLILTMARIGFLSSVAQIQNDSRHVVEQYCKNIDKQASGDDLPV
jgi:hypothetical protein